MHKTYDSSRSLSSVHLALSLICLLSGSLMTFEVEARVGDWDEPITVMNFPFTHRSDTSPRGASQAQSYSCAPQLDESGPEVIYQLNITQAGILVASVEGDNGTVDIDIHLLDRVMINGGRAEGCIQRDNSLIEQSLTPGVYWIAVDSYAGVAQAGAYTLRVHLEPLEGWYERPVAGGVILETKRYDSLFGGNQSGSVLRVDLDYPGVSVRPIRAQGCQTTSELGRSAGAVAAINGGYFGGGGCGSVSLIKVNGQLFSSNARSRSAFGITPQGSPQISWIEAGVDWPQAEQAVGGLSRLVSQGAVNVEWERDSATYNFTYGANPRTAVGFTGREVVLATLDGRTAAGAGASLFDFAQWLVWLGVSEGLNLDGGGSTTLWTSTEGVVSFPSDNGLADHRGERGVANALGVFAPPLSREAEWIVTGERAEISVGETLNLEVFARDPDGGLVNLSVNTSGRGDFQWSGRSDGTGLLTYTPIIDDDTEVTFTIEAWVNGQFDGAWSTRVQVLGTDQSAGQESGQEAGQGAGQTPSGQEAGQGAGQTPSGQEAGQEAGQGAGQTPSGQEAGQSSGGQSAGMSGGVSGAEAGGSQSAGYMAGTTAGSSGGTEAGTQAGTSSGGAAEAGVTSGESPGTSAGGEDHNTPPRYSMGRVGGASGATAGEATQDITNSESGVSCQASTKRGGGLWVLLIGFMSLSQLRRRSRSAL